MEESYFKPSEAATYLNVSLKTVFRLIERGLPSMKLSNTSRGGILIKKSWIDQWMEA